MKKIIIAIVLICACAGGYYGYSEFNRKSEILSDVKADFTISATELISSFETNEGDANELYLDKAVEVTGTVVDLTNESDTLVTIFLGNDGLGTVSCEMDTRTWDARWAPEKGEKVTIKGICTGYLMDVVLVRSVLLNE